MTERTAAQPLKATTPISTPVGGGVLRRKCSCGQHTLAGGKCEACCNKPLAPQRSAWNQTEPLAVPPILYDVLPPYGQPLDSATRAYMEPRFGHDFSNVRVHTDAKAEESAMVVNASAYTVGRDIVFGAGQYSPGTTEGDLLLAHELAHVVQQRRSPSPAFSSKPLLLPPDHPSEVEADRAAYLVTSGHTFRLSRAVPSILSRSALNVSEIKRNIESSRNTHPDIFSWLHVRGPRSGGVGHGATRPTGTGPDPAPVPTDPGLPINAYFFPSYVRHHNQRALILGGIHGNERPSFEVADALVNELQTASGPSARELYFHTFIIPRVNPGGIADNSRCNRQLVDLNRNFPVPGARPSSRACPNTATAPIQPETQAVINVLNLFQPHRILSLHAIRNPRSAGIFADPPRNQSARQLACSIAGLIVDPRNRRGNRLTSTRCSPVYPGATTGGTSLGAYAPTRSIQGQTVPVVTLEVPGRRSLGGTGTRTAEAFLRPVRGFLIDPATLASRADLDIVRDIQAFNQPLRQLFLTGRLTSSHDILRRIRERVEAKVAELQTLKPGRLPRIRIVSHYRGFGTPSRRRGGQAHIIFQKFTLTGSRRHGWDTLPDEYYIRGDRSRGVDRNRWLNESSARRLDIILRYSAVPGASRHHWGTDVDFNSTTNADWQPASGSTSEGRFYQLGLWLQANAQRIGFVQAYTPGRTRGHHEEPWHYSYAPIAVSLRQMYTADIRYREDVVDPVMDLFNRRAAAEGIRLPSDLRGALENLDISQYVNIIGPGL